jgi:hypothetical protein
MLKILEPVLSDVSRLVHEIHESIHAKVNLNMGNLGELELQGCSGNTPLSSVSQSLPLWEGEGKECCADRGRGGGGGGGAAETKADLYRKIEEECAGIKVQIAVCC